MRKKNIRKRRRWIAFGLLIVVAMVLYENNWLGKLIYPISYQKEINESARENGLDPLLVAAIIRVESNFKVNSESRKGAIGLMQVMPDTAEWVLDWKGFEKYSLADLQTAKINIEVGTRYLKFLFEQFDNQLPEVLAAYNAGQGNVVKWKQGNIWDGSLVNASQIPFRETRNYVHSVHYYYNKYNHVYSSDKELLK